MASPPANHPFMRPAIATVTQNAQNGTSQGTAYYSPPSASPPQAFERKSLSPRPPSTLSAAPRSRPTSPATPSQQDKFASLNGTATTEAFHEPWLEEQPPKKLTRWEEKVQGDLAGWRGGQGEPRSSVPQAGVPNSTYYGQPQTGTIGRDLPKEIVRIERDWSLGDVCQFSTTFPLELESRISPAKFTTFIEEINAPLREAYSVSGAVLDNLLAIATWWTSLMWHISHFEKELRRAEGIIRSYNESTFNPIGLNVLSPRDVALQYLEIEYY